MRVLFFLALCLMAVLAKYKGGADLPPDSDLRIGVKVSGTAFALLTRGTCLAPQALAIYCGLHFPVCRLTL